VLTTPAEEADSKPRDFMKAKDVLEDLLDSLASKSELKSFVGKTLAEDLRSLSDEGKATAAKSADGDKVLKTIKAKLDALKQLKDELPDIDKTSLPGWKARLVQARAELDESVAAAETHHDTVKHLLGKASAVKRKQQQSARYQRVKMAGKLTKLGCPEKLATLISDLEQSPGTPGPTAADTLNWCGVMLFDDSNAQGEKVLKAVDDYSACQVDIATKTKSLISFLNKETAKVGAMVAVPAKTGAQAKSFNLAEALGLVNGLLFEEDKGNCGWLTAADSWNLRRGAAQVPLPGLSGLYRLAKTEGEPVPVTLLATNLQPIIQAGLTILSDLVQFSSTDSGAKVVRDSSLAITLTNYKQVAYIPMGFNVMYFAHDDGDDKGSTGVLWHKCLMSKFFLTATPAQVWPAVALMNRESLVRAQGQKSFKERLAVFEKFQAERAWETLAVPQTLDEVADAIAASSG